MNNPDKNSEKNTRRQFIEHAVVGASLVGLGSGTALLADTPSAPVAERALGKEFVYDVSPLVKVDPELIRYEEETSIQTGVKELRSVAIAPDQRVYVAGDQNVQIFGMKGEAMGKFDLADRPRCLSINEDRFYKQRLYVGMTRHIEVFDLDGTRLAKWESLGENAVVTSIAASKNDVFVADAGNRVIVHFDLSGKKLGLIGKKNPAKDILGFVVPSPYFEINVGEDGLLWAANPARHRLEAYTFDGEFKTAWGETNNAVQGFCGCCNPIHFTRMAGGQFVTSEKGLPRVKVYSPEGQLQCVVAAPDSFPALLKNPRIAKPCMSLAVDARGRILLADANTCTVRIFSLKPSSNKKA